ncbi:MAG: 50S ribosomal protein L29 [Chitinophagales bacterium]|nr:50S ribosomal protein L29 [Chitinophagales bacterium]HPE96654.1 50S ribosomal protein L29 [Chitinophagales bacterium]HPR29008.1 50S ribosomal protein L29 [Chitinophagales bacterium]HQU39975.1 50S ribosomal protein L29 [Chitinophagales bacterium]HQU75126.1 50S ribosomal protein L29 [Chitinophagales bacterium]
MAKIKSEDLKSLNVQDLQQRLEDDRERLQKLQFNHAVNPLENPMQVRFLRREIARLQTEIRKRELAEN